MHIYMLLRKLLSCTIIYIYIYINTPTYIDICICTCLGGPASSMKSQNPFFMNPSLVQERGGVDPTPMRQPSDGIRGAPPYPKYCQDGPP